MKRFERHFISSPIGSETVRFFCKWNFYFAIQNHCRAIIWFIIHYWFLLKVSSFPTVIFMDNNIIINVTCFGTVVVVAVCLAAWCRNCWPRNVWRSDQLSANLAGQWNQRQRLHIDRRVIVVNLASGAGSRQSNESPVDQPPAYDDAIHLSYPPSYQFVVNNHSHCIT